MQRTSSFDFGSDWLHVPPTNNPRYLAPCLLSWPPTHLHSSLLFFALPVRPLWSQLFVMFRRSLLFTVIIAFWSIRCCFSRTLHISAMSSCILTPSYQSIATSSVRQEPEHRADNRVALTRSRGVAPVRLARPTSEGPKRALRGVAVG